MTERIVLAARNALCKSWVADPEELPAGGVAGVADRGFHARTSPRL
jgi:hypothetical protein